MNGKYLLAMVVAMAAALVPAPAADDVLITEFMAANNGPVMDEDGVASDWIEIHNAGTNTVNLNGWFLTDKLSQLTQWRFPATNLVANGYLLVFASGHDRRRSGAPLHTSFSLKAGGEYLALVRPDGTNIASAFSPAFPPQVSGVSYGIPVRQTVTTLVAGGAAASVLVPPDGSLGTTWAGPTFDDSGWPGATTGVGYERDTGGVFVPVLLADSVAEFSGTQGQDNWFYGYWDRNDDANGVYSDSEFAVFPNNYWTGAVWDWPGGEPPFTQLTSTGGRPTAGNGNPALDEHWAVRRWVSEVGGSIQISGSLMQSNDWVYVQQTGTAVSSLAYIYLLGAGTGYIDDMKLVAGAVPEAGANLLANGDFESANLNPWTVSANLSGSASTTAVKHSGTRSLRIVSTSAGASQGTAIWQTVSPALVNGQTYTLSYWFLPVPNSSSLVVRFSQGWINTTPDYSTVARIFVDGAQVFQQSAQLISADYSVTVPVRLGSHVDLTIDPGSTGNGLADTTTFTANIQTAESAGVVADSVADWSVTGRQGEKNWYHGYYNKNADPDRTYQATNFIAFPHNPGPQGPNNFWDEEEWDWFSGNPPFDKVGQYWMLPNGTNNGAEHWVIRRWVSEVSGKVTVEWSAFKELPDQNNLGGGGVTVRTFQNGIQRDSAGVLGADVVGVNRVVTLSNVQAGDTIDIALDPTNVGNVDPFEPAPSGPHDDTDRTFLTAVIRGSPTLTSQIASDLEASMYTISPSAYIRIPFTVADPSVFNSLTLRMKFDDGFVAYLNGVEVTRFNAPLLPDWSSAATADRSDGENNEWTEFNLSASLGLLQPGTNVLAIHGLNVSAGDADFLILPELQATTVTYDLAAGRYFMLPTPGGANGIGNTNLGPLVLGASHAPNVPKDNENLTVTASVTPTFNPVSGVRLIYRVMYGSEVNVAMFDDGLHGDGAAGDGTWGAAIPASASTPGQMVRYYVFATDSLTNGSRFPAYEDPKNSPRYQGTVVFNSTLTNPLPVLHFFVQTPSLAIAESGTRCSIFWDNEFFDNIEVNGHGQTTLLLPSSVFPKKSIDFLLNTGYKLRPKPGQDRVKAFDLLTTFGDKAYMRLPLAFETFRDAGVPTHSAFPVRVQQNSAFNSVMWFVEQANDDFLKQHGLDGDGAFYKIYFPLTNAYSGAKKVTRKNEPNGDLQGLIDGLNLSGPALRNFLFDNLDVAEAVNFFATIEMVQNEDCCYYKNYYLYRDTSGTGEWQIFPWDLDLTFGRTFTGWVNAQYDQFGNLTNVNGGYFDTNIFWMNAYYSEQRSIADFIGAGQPIFDALWSFPDTRDMFLRRWSSVQEQFLQKSNTHPLLFHYETRVDEMTAQLAPDAALDLALWGTWPKSPPAVQSQSVAAQELKVSYFARRRGWIFNTLTFANGGPYLGTQPTNAAILFGDIEFNPSSGNQNQEYLQLRNTNNYSVDVSGWKLTGGVEFTFKGGTIIPSNGVLYVSPDVNAFRARASGPGGGQGLFVQGSYKGQLSARGEGLQLADGTGRVVSSTNYPGNPSLAQQYLRVTELMYHPTAPAGSPFLPDEFEYIELKNISTDITLNLTAVRFANGIEFNFTGSLVTNLGPGEGVLVVRSLAAFVSLYGVGYNVAGEYAGALDNMGENIRLEDARGEKILDFTFNNSWYPITDGLGFSLVIANENAPWDTWDLKASWRPSREPYGSPTFTDPPPIPQPPILVTEVQTHEDAPSLDVIELFNPTANDVDIGGWFLTDDFNVPQKFRIYDGVIISAGGYWAFDEIDFNGPPNPFSFSSKGEQVYLFSADGNGYLSGYYHGFEFGAAEKNVTFGRYVTSVGQEHFVAQIAPSFLAANAGPLVGPVGFTEVHYRPPDLADQSDNSAEEFVELKNITGGPVNLFDPLAPGNTWHVRGGVDFDFPAGVTLTSQGFVLLVNFDPTNALQLAAFRAKFGVPAGVPVFGPYSGKLDNSAGSVKLMKPGTLDAGEVPYILVDQVDYTDSAPWPSTADGSGASLQRLAAAQYGNDPINWTAAAPTAGREFTGGAAPNIVMQPASQTAGASGPATLSVSASGSAPLRYQWRFNGATLATATNSILSISNVLGGNAGVYNVTVFNSAGSVESSNAVLTVLYGAYFTLHPASIAVRPGSNVTFTAFAASSTPVRYQWRFNGVNITGATNASRTVTNAQFASSGPYDVVATDGVVLVVSHPATLSLLIDPVIVQQPLAQTVVAGGNVTFSVGVTNTATLPVGYRWRRNGINLTNGFFILNERTGFFTVTNVQAPFTNYTVGVTNISRPSGFLSGSSYITILPDSDGDGIPNSWETTYGFSPTNGADGALDSDGDGMSNWQEWFAGTNPTNALSYLKVDSFTPGGIAMLQFGAISNRTYTIQYTDELNSGLWFKLADVAARNVNRNETIPDPNPADRRYYRVVTPRQP